MDYCLFDYENGVFMQVLNLVLVGSQSSVQAEDRIRLRYLQNPFGKAIILCGIEEGLVEVCLVIEKVDMLCYGKIHHCGWISAFSTKKGCVSQEGLQELLRLAEIEANNEGLEIVFAFEKLAELIKGKVSGWSWLSSEFQYRAMQIELFRSLFRITDMARPFVPETIVCSDYCMNGLPQQTDMSAVDFNMVSPVMSDALLDWYCSFGDGKEIAKVDNGRVGVVGYVGKRAGIKEFHLLNLFHAADVNLPPYYQDDALKSITASVKPDIITFEDGKQLLPEENTEFIKNYVDYGYKVLSGGDEDVEELAVALYRWFGIW